MNEESKVNPKILRFHLNFEILKVLVQVIKISSIYWIQQTTRETSRNTPQKIQSVVRFEYIC